ncbi:MAG: hypothetical protein IPL96_17250 [Holophagaceae bacterium]|nr:hypothetical protein [Holophagaceae bacterium]
MSFRSDARATALEIRQTLDTAFRLAARTNGFVTVEPEPRRGKGRIAPLIPKTLAWGKPARVPLPPRTLDARWAEAPKTFTLTPWHTATEGMWFLHAGSRALCVRISAKGEVKVLRFRPLLRRWTEV